VHAYHWVQSAAEVLRNAAQEGGREVKRRFIGLIAAMKRWASRPGPYHAALQHFLLETRRYWRGLFHCYAVPGLPRTNNDLETLFGSCRYHERRATGRGRGSQGLVVRGQVRLVAIAGARLAPAMLGRDIAPKNVADWRHLRTTLRARRHPRVLGRRFRHDPDSYLRALEAQLVRSALPP
jgi:hypothetical protein